MVLIIRNKSSKLFYHPIIWSVFYHNCCLSLVLFLLSPVTTTTAFTPTCFVKYDFMYKTTKRLTTTNLLISATPTDSNDCTTSTTDSFSKINDNTENDNDNSIHSSQRRNVISRIIGTSVLSSLGFDIISDTVNRYTNNNDNMNNNNKIANAAIGTLPEYSTTNYIIQGITVRVQNEKQLNTMIQFLQDGFNFKIIRQRITKTTEEVWLGYGPEQLSIPTNFVLPISSFTLYGGHSSICLLYEKSTSNTTDVPLLYNIGNTTVPGTNIAYIQLGVPGYRISQMIQNNGTIIDAYGIVDVISPIGIPIRGIVGIVPDPIMFIAINCNNIKESQLFYEQYLGFHPSEYPYARPSNGTGQFEPPQPKNSIYLSQTSSSISSPKGSSMGILLLQNKKSFFINNKQQQITVNPVVQSLNIIYSPTTTTMSTTTVTNNNDSSSTSATISTNSIESSQLPLLIDPSGVPIRLQSFSDFEKEEQATRIKESKL